MNVNHPCWSCLDAQYRPSDSFYDAVLLALGLDSKLPNVPLPFEAIETENVELTDFMEPSKPFAFRPSQPAFNGPPGGGGPSYAGIGNNETLPRSVIGQLDAGLNRPIFPVLNSDIPRQFKKRMLRQFMKYLSAHPELIDKLSETRPVRRAAQLAVGIFYRARAIGEEKLAEKGDPHKLLTSSWRQWLDNIGKYRNQLPPGKPSDKNN